jgi:long-chain fatty acid transport protein
MRAAALVAAGWVGCAPAGALASGFALSEHGASGLGLAYAGNAALATDPSTVFFNPAGMTRLPGRRLAVAGFLVRPSAEFRDSGSTLVGPGAAGPIPAASGGDADGGDAGDLVGLPNLYYTHALDAGLVLGVGIDAPFGLKTEYDEGWVGRYQAIRSSLQTINVNPAVALKLGGGFSLGVGINVMYADAELTRRLPSCALAGRPTGCDTFSKVSADDTSLGYNLGLLYELESSTRLGLAYRSRVTHDLEGEGRFAYAASTPVGIQAVLEGGGLRDSGADAELTLPDSLSLALYHAFDPSWAVMADVTWTHWSLVDTITIELDTGRDSPLELDYRNALRYGLGLSYAPPGSRWTWRAGVAYDEEPVRDTRTRTPRLPGSDRLWLAVGASYAASDSLTVDAGYAHLFVDDPRIAHTQTDFAGTPGETVTTVRGRYDIAIDILGVQATWRFD